jgi:hypothetical protein
MLMQTPRRGPFYPKTSGRGLSAFGRQKPGYLSCIGDTSWMQIRCTTQDIRQASVLHDDVRSRGRADGSTDIALPTRPKADIGTDGVVSPGREMLMTSL